MRERDWLGLPVLWPAPPGAGAPRRKDGAPRRKQPPLWLIWRAPLFRSRAPGPRYFAAFLPFSQTRQPALPVETPSVHLEVIDRVPLGLGLGRAMTAARRISGDAAPAVHINVSQGGSRPMSCTSKECAPQRKPLAPGRNILRTPKETSSTSKETSAHPQGRSCAPRRKALARNPWSNRRKTTTPIGQTGSDSLR